MHTSWLLGISIPFLGTMAGSACVFFLRQQLGNRPQKILLGFASGVMVAAAVWSLLIPALDLSAHSHTFPIVPIAVGFSLGIGALLLFDTIIPHLHIDHPEPEGLGNQLNRSTMLILAIILHNIPEGMAVGAIFAGLMADQVHISLSAAFALSIGIAIQNFPEGAIISLPLYQEGRSRNHAFWQGTLSGIAEPIAALLTILLYHLLHPLLPYLLAFAAGAMLYVVVEELIPQSAQGAHSNLGTIGFAVGFLLMMVLDVTLA